jgi:L-lactate dehydrogenase
MIILACSDSSTASVAPFGGLTPVFTPNPIAAGIPTSGDPILLDISASLTTNGMTNRLYQEGKKLPHPWIQDHEGNPTDDPAVLFNEPKGTLLPIGGNRRRPQGIRAGVADRGADRRTCRLGRADPQEGWGATVYLQVIDPAGIRRDRRDFAGKPTGWRGVPRREPRPGTAGVRLPGERGLALYRKQTAEGVEVYPGIIDRCAPPASNSESSCRRPL